MAHDHSHHQSSEALRNAFLLTLVILAIEIVAGAAANSLALLSDAGHILTDAVALALAWVAARLAARPPDARNTFGYRRSTILSALLNASVLVVIAIAVTVEAILRIRHPQQVDAVIIVPAALAAILVNSYIALRLHRSRSSSLNVRAALLHVVGDLVASAGVVAAGLAILIWRAYVVDPLLSLAIALLISYGAWHVVRDALSILMEGTPADVDLDRVREAMLEVPGVDDVHDLHVWALSDGFRLLSAHVSVPDQRLGDFAALLADLKLVLRRRFQIDHATIEPECEDCRVATRRPIQLHPHNVERPRAEAPTE